MESEIRKSLVPSWILFPVAFASSVAVLVAWGSGSLLLGIIAALLGAAAVAWWCEEMLRGVVGTIGQIAGGDRYAALPERTGSGALGDSAVAAERMRQVLIDADALAVAAARPRRAFTMPAGRSSPNAFTAPPTN